MRDTPSGPTPSSPELLIKRRDLRTFEVRESTRPEIDAGQVAVAVERASTLIAL